MDFRKLLRPRAERPRPDHGRLCGTGCRRSGVIPELLTRNASHPLLWFSLYHHSLHNLMFAPVIAALTFTLAAQKWKAGLLALLSSGASVCGRAGVSRSGWLSVDYFLIWRAVLFVAATCVARTLEPERLAERPDRDSALAGHALAGMTERILAAGDGLGRSRQFPVTALRRCFPARTAV
jgi:hypothetical protein